MSSCVENEFPAGASWAGGSVRDLRDSQRDAQTLMVPLRSATLLARRLAVGNQPRVDPPGTHPASAPADSPASASVAAPPTPSRTARRCAPWRSAKRTDRQPFRSRSRRICSNCSTLEPTMRSLRSGRGDPLSGAFVRSRPPDSNRRPLHYELARSGSRLPGALAVPGAARGQGPLAVICEGSSLRSTLPRNTTRLGLRCISAATTPLKRRGETGRDE